MMRLPFKRPVYVSVAGQYESEKYPKFAQILNKMADIGYHLTFHKRANK